MEGKDALGIYLGGGRAGWVGRDGDRIFDGGVGAERDDGVREGEANDVGEFVHAAGDIAEGGGDTLLGGCVFACCVEVVCVGEKLAADLEAEGTVIDGGDREDNA